MGKMKRRDPAAGLKTIKTNRYLYPHIPIQSESRKKIGVNRQMKSKQKGLGTKELS